MKIRVIRKNYAKFLIVLNFGIACTFHGWGNLVLSIILLWFVIMNEWER